MITASLGSHRFEAGPTYHYNAARAGELIDTMFNPGPIADYVNVLPDVDATPEEIQEVAAAGIVRLAVDEPEYDLIPQASGMLLAVCRGETDGVPRGIFRDLTRRDGYRLRGSLINSMLDSASVIATRMNNAAETAGLIGTKLYVDEGIFVVALGNGGYISAAHTFQELNKGNHELSFVRFSRNKQREREPNMYPYPDARKAALRRAAAGRQVLIYDEDYASGETLRRAVNFFGAFFDQQVIIGISPVEVERRITYKPIFVEPE